MENAINKLAQLHIRTRQLSDFEDINRKISPYNPIIYAFENYPNTPNRNSDFSFYFKQREFFEMQKSLNRNISSYSKRVISSEIGAIAQDNKEIFDGFWLEKDWRSDIFRRTLIYANINDCNAAKRKLIDDQMQEQLNIYFTTSEQETKILLKQIGAVYLKRLLMGKKIVFKVPSEYLDLLPRSSLGELCIKKFKQKYGAINAMLHMTHLKWKKTIALELITPSEERFSSQEFWEDLLGSMEYQFVNAKNMYGYAKEDGMIAISGINHIKIPIDERITDQGFRDRTKLYSGILVRRE